jgi:hypothetical protein
LPVGAFKDVLSANVDQDGDGCISVSEYSAEILSMQISATNTIVETYINCRPFDLKKALALTDSLFNDIISTARQAMNIFSDNNVIIQNALECGVREEMTT